MTTQLIVALLILVILAFAAFPIIWILDQHPVILVGALVGLYVGSYLLPDNRLPGFTAGGVSVYPLDLLCGVMSIFIFPFFYFKLKDGFTGADWPILLICSWALLLGLNYIDGLRSYGLQNATNEFRGYFYTLSTLLFVASRDIRPLWPQVERLWLWGSVVLVGVALIGYADGNFTRTGRPIDSTSTLFLLQTLLIALFLFTRGQLKPAWIPFCLSLFPLIVLLQHRSVWVVMLFGFGMVILFLPQMRPLLIKWGTIGLIVFGSLAGALLGPSIFETLSESYKEAVTVKSDTHSKSTFAWRMEGWTSLLTGEQMDSPREILFGNPFGRGWERMVTTSDGVLVARTESPHNFYLQTALRSGVVGLLVVLMFHYSVVRALLKRANERPELRPILLCLVVLILSQLIYYIPYSTGYLQVILLGSAIGWLKFAETQQEGIGQAT